MTTTTTSWRDAPIDPARLVRAAACQVEANGNCYRVVCPQGEPHWVAFDDPDVPLCDCADHTHQNVLCKHALAALLHERNERVLLKLVQYTPAKAVPAFPDFVAGMRLGLRRADGEWVPVTVVGPPVDGALSVRPPSWSSYTTMTIQLRAYVWGATMELAANLTFRRTCRACRGLGYDPTPPKTRDELNTKPAPCKACHGMRHRPYDPWKPGAIVGPLFKGAAT